MAIGHYPNVELQLHCQLELVVEHQLFHCFLFNTLCNNMQQTLLNKGLIVYLSVMLDLKMSVLLSSSSSRSCCDFVTISLLSGKSVLTNTVAGKSFSTIIQAYSDTHILVN